MAKFVKVHHKNDDGEIEEYTVNLEMITAVNEEDQTLDLPDCTTIEVVRESEWNKIMRFVKENMYD